MAPKTKEGAPAFGATAARIAFWLRHPRLLLARARYWAWEKLNPEKPWLCPGTIRCCERLLTPSMKALEFGSGRSTSWLARRVGRLVSVEHSPDWHRRVRRDLEAKNIGNVDYRFIALDHPELEPERERYDPLPAYVRVLEEFKEGALDFIVIDGHYRTTCIKRALGKLKPGGLLLVDDVNFWSSFDDMGIPRSWRLVDMSDNGLKRAGIWEKP